MTKISTRQRDGVTILDPKGKITIGEGDIALREVISEALAGGCKDLLINCSKVRRMDSSGLGELVAATERAKGQGASIKLTNLSASVRELLTMTALMGMLDVFDSEDKALASFG